TWFSVEFPHSSMAEHCSSARSWVSSIIKRSGSMAGTTWKSSPTHIKYHGHCLSPDQCQHCISTIPLAGAAFTPTISQSSTFAVDGKRQAEVTNGRGGAQGR